MLPALPVELQRQICTLLDRKSKLNLRLASRFYLELVTEYISEAIELSDTKESAWRFAELLESPFRCCVGHLIYDNEGLNLRDAHENGEDSDEEPDICAPPGPGEPFFDEHIFADYYPCIIKKKPGLQILAQLQSGQLPKLTALTVRFPWWDNINDFDDEGYFRTFEYQCNTAHGLARTLTTASVVVDTLRVSGLQAQTGLRGFQPFLKPGLKTLALSIVDIYVRAQGGDEFFSEELPRFWLTPAQETLTSLSLSFDTVLDDRDDAFGYLPKLELRGLFFPCLEQLLLGNYAFTHDWQLDWICLHSNLKKLVLYRCFICFFINLESLVDQEGYPDPDEWKYPGITPTHTRTYDRTWAEILTKFRKELQQLRVFEFKPYLQPGNSYVPEIAARYEWRKGYDEEWEEEPGMTCGEIDLGSKYEPSYLDESSNYFALLSYGDILKIRLYDDEPDSMIVDGVQMAKPHHDEVDQQVADEFARELRRRRRRDIWEGL